MNGLGKQFASNNCEVLMTKLLITMFILLLVSVTNANQIKVMIIDTGFDFKSKWTIFEGSRIKLCDTGHKDFTNTSISDTNGHGTHVAGLIGKYAADSNYCAIIVKFFDLKSTTTTAQNTLNALKYAIEQNVDIINYSAGGEVVILEECNLVKKALDQGILFVAAAGNNGSDLNLKKYYPAMCDDRVLKISNINSTARAIATTSNFSEETISVSGTDVVSTTPNESISSKTGTSQAAAIYTGKLIKTLQIINNRKGR